MVNVTISLPDELAQRAERVASDRGLSVRELATEAVEAYLGRTGRPRELPFIALDDGPDGFSARAAEQDLEDNGFTPSH